MPRPTRSTQVETHEAMLVACLDLSAAEIAALAKRLRPRRSPRSWIAGLVEVHRMHELTGLFPLMAALAGAAGRDPLQKS